MVSTDVLDPAGPTAIEPRRPRRARPWLPLVATLIGLVFAAPTGYLVVENLSRGTDLLDTFASRATLDPLRRTLLLAFSVSAGAAVAGTALAWLTVRTDVPGRRLWRVLAPLPLVIPSFVGAAALLAAFATGGLVDELFGLTELPHPTGFPGALFVLVLFTYPYVYLPVAARLASLPPSLEESARLLGSRPWTVFRTVVLPQTTGAVWAGALLVFLYTVSDFGAVQLLRYDTLTRRIYASQLLDRDLSLALGLILALVALAVVVGERRLSRHYASVEAPGGRGPLTVALGRWRWPALVVVVAIVGNALLGPMAVLGWWAVRGAADVGFAELGPATMNTASVGIVAAVVAVAVVLPVAYLTTRRRGTPGAVANALVVGGFALPGLVVALALASWVLRAPGGTLLYQSLPLLILAYVIHFGAQAMRAAQVAVGAVPHRLDDAARMLGAGRVRRLMTVDLPLMRPGLIAGAGLVMLSAMKELPATLLLRPTGFDTLATRIWAKAEEGFQGEAGLTSLVLIALSGVLTWWLVVRSSTAGAPR